MTHLGAFNLKPNPIVEFRKEEFLTLMDYLEKELYNASHRDITRTGEITIHRYQLYWLILNDLLDRMILKQPIGPGKKKVKLRFKHREALAFMETFTGIASPPHYISMILNSTIQEFHKTYL